MQVGRYVPHASEQQRFAEVLDHFIDWSAVHATSLVHHDSGYEQHVVSFARVVDGSVFWSAYPRMVDGAKFEITPRTAKYLNPALQDEARALFGSISTEALTDDGTLRVRFSALKNLTTRQRVTDLLERLLV
ncbi:MAG: hypothetical protein ABS52_15430 [Gemmatimonadetes bacterium SCN 70-22]|nr:MAG: hypothetical protein ABS52_15430 [Gemmatimonadetes bacterium SCN 70-22]